MIAGPGPTVAEREPYVGLRPYGVADADRFFGREREIWELTSLMLSSRLVVVYGPVNIGKTSLLQAGVLAALEPDAAQVLPVARLPRLAAASADPASDDSPRVEPSYVQALLASWEPDAPPAALRKLSLARYLKGLPVRSAEDADIPLPLVVVLDQVEEIFADEGPAGIRRRDELLGQLRDALVQVPNLHLTLCLRQEAMGQLLPHETALLPGGLRRYRLDGLDRDHAAAAVEAPVAAAGRTFAPGVADDLVDRIVGWTTTDAGGEARSVVDPARLQVVCLSLWRTLDEGVTTITPEVVDACFDDASDVDATLTTFCVRAVMDIAAAHDVPELDAWAWLEHTFITELGTRATAHRGTATTAGMPNDVVEAFEEHMILRSEQRAGALWFELQHDVLIEPIRSGRRLAESLAAGETGEGGAAGAAGGARGSGEAGPIGGVGAEAFLRMARRALRDGLLPLAEEYARGALRAAGERDPRRAAEANVFLGELVLGRVPAEAERVDELYETAERSFRRAAELFDAEQDVRAVGQQQASLGRLLLRRGRYVDALAELRGALDRLRGDLRVRIDFAQALDRAGLSQAALGELTAVLVLVDENRALRAEALLQRGLIEAEHGDPDAADHDLAEAVRLEPRLATPEVAAVRRRVAERLASLASTP